MNSTNIEITSPVLLMVFNRPDRTQQVFDVIRSVKPKKLYIAADAPRTHVPADAEKCKQVREIVSQIDWDCDANFLFHENNLGCSLAGKSAWDWLFSHEDRMIFIEDDGLVSKSFFGYCQVLLDKYEHDERIGYIGGVNYGPKFGEYSYFFSKLPAATYCMATWKRVYDLYEFKMESYKETKDTPELINSFPSPFWYNHMKLKFDNYTTKGGNTYDCQMLYLVFRYNMLSIYPNINLASNIGLDTDGANNKNSADAKIVKHLGYRPKFEITEINHPPEVYVDKEFEKYFFTKRVFWEKSRYYKELLRFKFPLIEKIYRKIVKR